MITHRWKNSWPFVILITIGVGIYANSLHSPFQFDDLPFIVYNSQIQNLRDFSSIWQWVGARPVGTVTFALNYHFGQLNVLGYHIVNIAIHVMVSCLVWWFVILTLETPRLKNEKISEHKEWLAFFSALLFLTHPIQSTAVNHITQRYASLAAFFYLTSLCFYIKARLVQGKYYYLVLSMAAAILAMLTRQPAITLPFAIILYEYFFLNVDDWKRNLSKNIHRLTLAAFLSIFLIIPAIYSFDLGYLLVQKIPSQSHVNDIITWDNYFLTQMPVLVTYLKLLVFPKDLNFDYDFAVSNSLFETETFISFLLLALLVLSAVKIFPRNRLVSFGIFWFFLTLSIESSIIPIAYVIAEYRMYLPYVGLCLAATGGLYSVIRNFKMFITAVSIICVVFAYMTFERNKVWQSEIALWQDTVNKSPYKARPHSNLGASYLMNKDYDKALFHFQKAVEFDPQYDKGYYNICSVYSDRQDYSKAIDYCLRAVMIQPSDRDSLKLLGYLYFKKDEFKNALECFKALILLQDDTQSVVNYFKTVVKYYLMTNDKNGALDYVSFLRKYKIDGIADELESVINNKGQAP